ncbi:hypothetical protein ABZ723_29375 [Streptomyces sp. NPDC006700]
MLVGFVAAAVVYFATYRLPSLWRTGRRTSQDPTPDMVEAK